MIRKTISELAELVNGQVVGDGALVIDGVADLGEAGAGKISFAADKRWGALSQTTRAAAVVVPGDYEGTFLPVIKVKDPILAIATIHNLFVAVPFAPSGVSSQAAIAEGCVIPEEVSIAPMAVLGRGVELGQRVTIHAGVVLGDRVVVGDDCILHANVTVYPGCRLGNRVILHSGCVIGSDGFGYATTPEGIHVKRPHVGTVQIDDDVEIGANVCVDRATFGCTRIRKGTKIDNLVQIAHNVEVGESCLIVGQAGIAGSTTLGRNVVLGGQVGLVGHITLGDRAMVGAQSGVHNDQDPGTIVSGTPAIPHHNWLRASMSFAKLPELVKDVRNIKKQLAELLTNHT